MSSQLLPAVSSCALPQAPLPCPTRWLFHHTIRTPIQEKARRFAVLVHRKPAQRCRVAVLTAAADGKMFVWRRHASSGQKGVFHHYACGGVTAPRIGASAPLEGFSDDLCPALPRFFYLTRQPMANAPLSLLLDHATNSPPKSKTR